MKKIILCSLVCLFFGACSQKSNDPMSSNNSNNQNNKQAVADTMTATFLQNNWVATSFTADSSIDKRIDLINSRQDHYVFYNFTGVSSDSTSIMLTIPVEYDFNSSTNSYDSIPHVADFASFIYAGKSDTTYDVSYNSASAGGINAFLTIPKESFMGDAGSAPSAGSITITHFDGNYMAGTFAFSVTDTYNQATIPIANGKFVIDCSKIQWK